MLNRSKFTNDILFERLNNYHPKTKFTVELNPNIFLNTRLICVNDIITPWSIASQPNYQELGRLNVVNGIRYY